MNHRLERLTRRRFLGVAAGMGTAVVLGSCTNDDNDPAASSGGSGSASDTFPVSVEHAFGTTEVPAEPTRVACAGLTEQDSVLALGITPIATTEWYGEYPYACWPWAQDELGGAQPEVLSVADGFQFERIAALAPDLILATNAGLVDGDYEKLSAIAPTIAHSGKHSDYFEPWKVQTTAIGRSLGKAEEVQDLIGDVAKRFSAARADHPEFEGKSAVFLQNKYYEGSVIAYQDGLSTQFLTDLGFVIPKEIEEYEQSTQAVIPKENMVDVLDVADVLIWATETDEDRENFLADSIFQQLQATQEDRNVYTGGELAGAIYFTSPLSLPYVVEQLVPMLATALES